MESYSAAKYVGGNESNHHVTSMQEWGHEEVASFVEENHKPSAKISVASSSFSPVLYNEEEAIKNKVVVLLNK